MKYNLVDSCGWLEYFTAGPNARFFDPALKAVDHLIVPTICLAEVFKVIYREKGRRTAAEFVAAMKRGRVVDLDHALAVSAGLIGVNHQLPLADSIILATARAYHAELWTQDEHFKQFPEVKFISKS